MRRTKRLLTFGCALVLALPLLTPGAEAGRFSMSSVYF